MANSRVKKIYPIIAVFMLLIYSGCTPAQKAPVSVGNIGRSTAAENAGPPEQGRETTLTVLAAASLTEAFDELQTIFEVQNPGVKVSINYAGSQQLAQQLAQGAPADAFASASQKYMDAAAEAGRVDPGEERIFAHNSLVLITPVDNPGGIRKLQDLARPGLKLALAAKEVPAGQYSLEFLEKAAGDAAFTPDFKDRVLNNVVSYEENVKSVLAKITLGEADAGIVYSSDISTKTEGRLNKIEIPDSMNVIANYPIALIKDGGSSNLAQKFIDLVLSDAGQAVLKKYNFLPAS